MANMGYCRFENTGNDLYDCVEELQEAEGKEMCLRDFNRSLSSDHERHALRHMYELCLQFVAVYEAMEEANDE